ncbi:MAG: Exosome complex component Csl4 [ANME-2 cluster archaeon]|nr:Exosome complex component Csl4 [ANME-2 cluster archaeon]
MSGHQNHLRGIIIRIKRKKSVSRRKLGTNTTTSDMEVQEEVSSEEEVKVEELETVEEVDKVEGVKKSEDESIAVPEKQEITDKPSEVQETREFVLPGDMIGTAEEFISNNNTFKYGGNIYSSATGQVKVNNKTRTISVVPETDIPPMIKNGDVVIGRVNDLRSSVALVEIAMIEGKGEREIVNLQPAAIHVSNVKDSYVKSLDYEFSPFDLVRAKVIDVKAMRLSTSGNNLGVIKAYCSKCNVDMEKQSNNGNKGSNLKCPVCGNIESRKLAANYGNFST